MNDDNDITNKSLADISYIRYYWIAWGIIVILIISGISVVRWLIPGRANAIEGYFIPAYMISTWLPLIFINYFEGRRLMEYLKKHHFEKWKELTYVPGFGSGGRNDFRAIGFVQSDDDLSDPQVRFLKQNYRYVQILVWTIFFSFPVLFLFIAFT